MDEQRKQQLINLLRIFDITTQDSAALLRYDQALTHSSYAKEQRDRKIPCEDNERLEFFGDCVLDFIISRILYESFSERVEELRQQNPKKKDEQLFTDLLHDITNNDQLSDLVDGLDSFVAAIRCGNRVIPNMSIKADAFEAFIAAIYEDQGIEKTRSVVTGLFKDRIKDAKPIVSWKNKLQECVQKQERTAQVGDIIDYKTSREEGTPDEDARHISEVYVKRTGKDWELWGKGYGKKKMNAETDAAKNAFNKYCQGF